MSPGLFIEFSKQFKGGPAIQAALRSIPGDEKSGADITALFGPSGSGKTTVLRCVAGLESPDSGEIRIGDDVVFDSSRGVNLPAHKRRVGFMHQDYALFPHLTARENVEYGLRGITPAGRAQRAGEVMGLCGVTDFASQRPGTLSGGQKQRVALARALAPWPQVLLLDEPLSALNTSLREELRGTLRRVLHEAGVPALLVTHERAEAMALAGSIAVMDGGRVVQHGPLAEVFSRPASEAVARITGVETVVRGAIIERKDGLAVFEIGVGGRGEKAKSGEDTDVAASPQSGIRSPGQVRLTALDTPHQQLGPALAFIRAEDVSLTAGPGGGIHGSPRNRLGGIVTGIEPYGALVRVHIDAGFALVAAVTPQAIEEMPLKPGATVTAVIKAPAVHVVV